ncbi:MAG: ABC transporter substrate-binding protein [Chloroflexota bacterium]|nr:sugar ABC transporter substrate-binding protein [Caldilinea sp.]GIK72957.1 MAG: ABC transporter substrate-binding protein [Chloroflexota bacterium]
MNRKRTSCMAALFVLLSLLLSACAAPVGESAPAPAADASGAPSGKLLVWMQQANQDVFEQTVLDGFKAEYPDIELEWVNYPPAEVANQVSLAIQGGTGGPDLAVTENASIARLVELGGLTDLTDLMQPYLGELNAAALAEGSKDGKAYCAPWDIGPVVTFYRRDVFRQAGLSDDPAEVSAQISTWDGMLNTCKQIKEATGLNCFALNKANNYGDYFFNMLWQQGLDLYSDDGRVVVDSPEHIATLEKLGQFWQNEVVSDELEWTDNWYAELNAPLDDPNVKPVASIVIASWMGSFLKSWIAADRAGDWGVAQMPAFTEGGVRAANQGGSCMFIPEASRNKEAAWAFIEYTLFRPENHLKHFAYSDYFPAWEALYDDPMFEEPDAYFGGEPVRLVYAEAAKAIPQANQYGPYSQAIRGAVATAVQKYAMGMASAEQALMEAANAIRVETGLQ